jgi:hypothetical protein
VATASTAAAACLAGSAVPQAVKGDRRKPGARSERVGLYVLVLAVTLIALNHHGAIVPVPGNATGVHPTPSAKLCQATTRA